MDSLENNDANIVDIQVYREKVKTVFRETSINKKLFQSIKIKKGGMNYVLFPSITKKNAGS